MCSIQRKMQNRNPWDWWWVLQTDDGIDPFEEISEGNVLWIFIKTTEKKKRWKLIGREGLRNLEKQCWSFVSTMIWNIFSESGVGGEPAATFRTHKPRLKFHSGLIDREPSNQQPVQFSPIHLWPVTAANSLALSIEPQKWPTPIASQWEWPDSGQSIQSVWMCVRKKGERPRLYVCWNVSKVTARTDMSRLVFVDSGQYHS